MIGNFSVTITVFIFVCLTVLTVVGRFELLPSNSSPAVTAAPPERGAQSTTLFIYVHGLDRGKFWPSLRNELHPYGDALKVSYGAYSNADPLEVSRKISQVIEDHFQGKSYQRVVLLGQSIGALLVKRALLTGEKASHDWTKYVARVVLLAGMNRGWDISGQKPSDMSFDRWIQIWLGTWAARLAGFGKLVLSSETGTPFVANLRVDWMSRMRSADRPIEVVQLLGDIDDIVSEEDNKDLRSIDDGQFAWIKVRGTGHGNIVDFRDDQEFGNVTLGSYRRQKFLLAATEDFDRVALENEVQPFEPDPNVTHVVFVVHGIRDLGEWAAVFESELQRRFKETLAEGSSAKLAIASVRYGYFGMGPFLLRPIRDKYVKWFMDEYTETLARYPKASEIHFVGHSNGTYLLAAALDKYSSLKVQRVVFGGSVVRKNYAWKDRFKNAPKLRVRNYVAADDWVVALFPRFFEPPLIDKLLSNDIGSAGFNGFETDHASLSNVAYLRGGHGAFLDRIPEIAGFILNDPSPPTSPIQTGEPNVLLKWGSAWATWVLVWPLLAAVIVYVGWHVVTAAPEPRWPFFLAYIGLLLVILKNV